MAIVFPASPSNNDTFTVGSITYTYDGSKWIGLGVTPTDRLIEGSNSLEINASNNLVYSGGNTGIGIDNPSAKLEVEGSGILSGTHHKYLYASNNGILIKGNEAAIDLIGSNLGSHSSSILLRNADAGFGFVNSATGDSLILKSFTTNSDSFYIHATGVGVTSLVDIATFAKDGNVGINEATPDSKLDIVHSTTTNAATENLIHLRTDPAAGYVTRGLFVKIGRDGAYDNSAVHYDIVGSSGNSGTHIFEVQGGEKLRITKDGAVVPGANVTQPLGTNTLRWQNVYAQSYRFNDNGRIDYNITANTMEIIVAGDQQAEFTNGSFVPVSSADNVALGTTAKRWGAIRGQSLDINGTVNPVTFENTGGATLNLVRSSKSLSFNANYSAANTHASIEVTSGMDLAFYLGGSERTRFESDGEVRFTGQVRITEERPYLRLISSAATSNTDPRAVINFECQNSDNDEDQYRINFWEGNSSGETNNANASIRYNGSTSDGGDGAIRFVNENGTRLFSVNRLGGGNILGTLAQNSSDIRLKENITPIENALDKINLLTGFTYTWNQEAKDAGLKGDEHDCVQVGVSAQDVQKVQPEAVKPSPVDREKYITVQYEKLVPLLIEAIKELKEEVEELKRTN